MGLLLWCACAPDATGKDPVSSAGAGGPTTSGSGGAASGGSGGNATGGSATGGSATGGSATGGSATGGSAAGGQAPVVLKWSFDFGGTADDDVHDVALGSDGSVAIVGYFRNTLFVGVKQLESAGETDMFVVKLSAGGGTPVGQGLRRQA